MTTGTGCRLGWGLQLPFSVHQTSRINRAGERASERERREKQRVNRKMDRKTRTHFDLAKSPAQFIQDEAQRVDLIEKNAQIILHQARRSSRHRYLPLPLSQTEECPLTGHILPTAAPARDYLWKKGASLISKPHIGICGAQQKMLPSLGKRKFLKHSQVDLAWHYISKSNSPGQSAIFTTDPDIEIVWHVLELSTAEQYLTSTKNE